MPILSQNKIIKFSCKKIVTELNSRNEEKKKLIGMPSKWTELNESNIKVGDKAVFIITGKKCNLTIIDFDNEQAYDKLILKFPEMRKYYTVKTNKGFHIYFLYCDKYESGIDVFSNYDKIDILNDFKCVIAPPTSYKKLNNEVFKYTEVDGCNNTLCEIPNFLLNELILKTATITDTKVKTEVKIETVVKVKKELSYKEGKTKANFIERLLNELEKDRVDNWEKWRNIGFIMHYELPNETGYEIFKKWSQLSDKFNLNKLNKFWDGIIDSNNEKQLTLDSLMKISLKDDAVNYKETFDEFIISDKKIISAVGVFNDLEAAQTIFGLYPHFVCCNGLLYVFDDEIGLWTDKEEVLYKIITRFKDSLMVLTTNKKGEILQTKKGYGDSSSLKKQMIPELKTLCINNNWENENMFSSIGKILFLNGYYNMKTGIFTEGFTSKIVFQNKIYRNYDVKYKNNEYIKDVLIRFIYNQLGENVGNFFLLQIARGMAGDIMKKFMCGLGEADAGKSTIVKACSSAFGEYVGTFNAENLCFSKSSSDEAAQLRWAYLLRYKRLIFSSEIKMNTEINGNMIKKISSGGDALIARVHGGLETEFIPHFLAITYANDAPKISGIDTDPAINNRMKFITYTKKYVKEPSNEFELKIDDGIDVEIVSNEFKNAFQFIIFDIYLNFFNNGKEDNEPDEIKQFKIEWVGDTKNKVINTFLESYAITNDINNFTMSSVIDEFLIKEKIGITITKFTMELKKYCKLNKYLNVESKAKKINGKSKVVWLGIKEITEDDEDEDGEDGEDDTIKPSPLDV